MDVSEFLGINNVSQTSQLKEGEFAAATNVDIGSRSALLSRRGREQLRLGAASSIYEASFGALVVLDGDLLLVDSTGATIRTVLPRVGSTRMWYVTLPDGRVAFTNGRMNGLATLTATAAWGIEPPADAGAGVAGPTPYMVTYVRSSDRLESAPTYGEAVDATQALVGLPVRAGHFIRVYFAPNGSEFFLDGDTATDTYVGSGLAAGPKYRGHGVGAPPVGGILHTWRSRVLVADGSVLWATRPFQPEQCDYRQDFVQLPSEITDIYGSPAGVFVGTVDGLYFLAGTSFDELRPALLASGYVVKGSFARAELSFLKEGVRPAGSTEGAFAIVDRAITLLAGSTATPLTAARYKTSATEVIATTRVRDGVLQYIASPV